jgi:hypothetical protein
VVDIGFVLCIGVVGVSCAGDPGMLGDLAGLVGQRGVGVAVVGGDPGEQLGFAGQQRGGCGGVAGEVVRV